MQNRLVPLKEICNFVNGDRSNNYPKKSEFTKLGIPFISSQHLIDGKVDLLNVDKINEIAFSRLRSGKTQKGDLVLCIRGSIGKNAFITFDRGAIASSLVIIRPKGGMALLEYLYYCINSNFFIKQLKNFDNGSVQGNLSVSLLKEILIPDQSLSAQLEITTLLRNIDKKIELNNKINSELESLAKTIYDYWFVQFDFLDENGKPYKSSGGKMVWNDELKREIPEGWEVMKLDSIESNIVTGKTPSTNDKSNFGNDVPFICIGDVRGHMHIIKTELKLSKVGADSQKNKYIPSGSICVTCIATPGLVGFTTENSQTNQQLNTIVCEKFENRYYLYFYFRDYFKYAKAKTGNTFANMNKEDFSSILVLKPNSELLKTFSNKINPFIEKVLINSKENEKLTELRDWLIPLLMNGQVVIK